MITIGVDAHKRTHTMVAIDGTGATIGEVTVSAVPTGHAQALRWAVELGDPDLLWAVEDSRLYTRLLEHELLSAHQRVVRVPTVMMAHTRKSARTWASPTPSMPPPWPVRHCASPICPSRSMTSRPGN